MAAHKRRKKKKHLQPKDKKKWRKGPVLKAAYNFCKERDGWKCQMCGCPIDLTCHHLEQGAHCPPLRYDPLNLVCLCDKHHTAYHRIYNGYSKGKAINTRTFIMYLRMNEYYCDNDGTSHHNVLVTELIDTVSKRIPYLNAIMEGKMLEEVELPCAN